MLTYIGGIFRLWYEEFLHIRNIPVYGVYHIRPFPSLCHLGTFGILFRPCFSLLQLHLWPYNQITPKTCLTSSHMKFYILLYFSSLLSISYIVSYVTNCTYFVGDHMPLWIDILKIVSPSSHEEHRSCLENTNYTSLWRKWIGYFTISQPCKNFGFRCCNRWWTCLGYCCCCCCEGWYFYYFSELHWVFPCLVVFGSPGYKTYLYILAEYKTYLYFLGISNFSEVACLWGLWNFLWGIIIFPPWGVNSPTILVIPSCLSSFPTGSGLVFWDISIYLH